MTSHRQQLRHAHTSAGRLRDETVRRGVGIPSEADHDVVVDVVQEPIEQPYGVRDCASRDPAGNLTRINELR